MDTIFCHVQENYAEVPLQEIGINGGSCRFCQSSEATFHNRSHAIPEFLGNKTIFTLDECDSCNSFFGKGMEKTLKEFLMPSWFYRLKGKKGWAKGCAAGGIEIVGDDKFLEFKFPKNRTSNKVEISCQSRKIDPVCAYKALVKILISVMPNEFLHEFANVIAWLKNDNEMGFSILKHKPLVCIGTQMPDSRLLMVFDVCLVRQSCEVGAVYWLEIQANNLYVKIPFSTSTYTHFRLKGENENSSEVDFDSIYFDFIDFSKMPSRWRRVLKVNFDFGGVRSVGSAE